MNMNELRSEAKSRGINSFGKTKVELTELLETVPVETGDAIPVEESETLEKVLSKPKAKKVVKREIFVPNSQVAIYLGQGFKQTEMEDTSGYSVPDQVREAYKNGVRTGELVYMTK